MSKEGQGCIPYKKRILPSWLIESTEKEPKSPPSKRRRLTYQETREFLMSNKRVKSVFVRQRASPEGETKEQRLVRLEKEKQRKRLSRQNKSDEQRQRSLEAQQKRNRVRLQIETSDQRYHRLQVLRERDHERRQKESEEQHQVRLEDLRERAKTKRI